MNAANLALNACLPETQSAIILLGQTVSTTNETVLQGSAESQQSAAQDFQRLILGLLSKQDAKPDEVAAGQQEPEQLKETDSNATDEALFSAAQAEILLGSVGNVQLSSETRPEDKQQLLVPASSAEHPAEVSSVELQQPEPVPQPGQEGVISIPEGVTTTPPKEIDEGILSSLRAAESDQSGFVFEPEVSAEQTTSTVAANLPDSEAVNQTPYPVLETAESAQTNASPSGALPRETNVARVADRPIAGSSLLNVDEWSAETQVREAASVDKIGESFRTLIENTISADAPADTFESVERPSEVLTREPKAHETAVNTAVASLRSESLSAAEAETVAGPNVSQPVDPTLNAKIINQIVRSAKVQLTEGRSEMALRLDPPHLGNVNMSVTVQEGSVSAIIQTATESARQALVSNLDGLRQSLIEAGVRVDSINVTIGGDLNHGLQYQPQGQQYSPQGHVSVNALRTDAVSAADAVPNSTIEAANTQWGVRLDCLA